MKLKILIPALLITLSATAYCQAQTELNQTDAKGRKQGHWIKKYPDETIQYEGYFKDDHPVGEFKRYYEDKTLKSDLNFSPGGKEATASLYHPNGYLASKGKYVNQQKEGKWQFYSEFIKNWLIAEETYSADKRNGLTVRYYPDSTISEKINYVNDVKEGEWTRYYPGTGGKLLLKSTYEHGILNGKFETWFESGKVEFSGQYRNDARDGQWIIYNEDGSVKYKLLYENGITKDRQMDIDQAKVLDAIINSKEIVEDPAKTGIKK
jgi:antitoxin component YwqK of YwqJK toxin-antitoxin module